MPGAGDWIDEQFARAIREGIGRDGRRLFPMMPYLNFRQISGEDLAEGVTRRGANRPAGAKNHSE